MIKAIKRFAGHWYRRETAVDAATFARIVGRDQADPNTMFEVTSWDGRLSVRRSDQSALRTFPMSEWRRFHNAVNAQLRSSPSVTATPPGWFCIRMAWIRLPSASGRPRAKARKMCQSPGRQALLWLMRRRNAAPDKSGRDQGLKYFAWACRSCPERAIATSEVPVASGVRSWLAPTRRAPGYQDGPAEPLRVLA
jgi:hypothetical protein